MLPGVWHANAQTQIHNDSVYTNTVNDETSVNLMKCYIFGKHWVQGCAKWCSLVSDMHIHKRKNTKANTNMNTKGAKRCRKVLMPKGAERCRKVPKGAERCRCRKVPKVKHMFLSLGATHLGELFTLGLIHFAQYMRLTKGDKVKHMFASLGKNTFGSSLSD